MVTTETVRILYIDDDLGLARLFQRRLKRFGYEVEIAPDGEQGLRMYETGTYHLLFLDHQMPGYTGLDVIRKLAEAGPLPATIMITGAGDETVAVEAMKLGVADYAIKDGEGRYLDLIPSMVDRALARQRLLEEKQRAERALLDSEFRFRQLAENIQEVFWLNAGRRFLYVSPAYEQIWGKSCESLYLDSESFLQSIHCGDRDLVIEALESRERTETEFKIVRPDGTIRWIGARLFPIDNEAEDAPDKAGIAEDITERKISEQLLIQSERLKAVGELASGVAHNFNNLLQIIMGSAQLVSLNLELGDLTSAKEDIDQILESSRFGAETVRRLQSFAKLNSDGRVAEGKIFDLSNTVRQAVEMSKIWWKTIPERKGISINMTERLNERCMVGGRQNELFEVIVNLIKNAAEALPRGGDIRVETFVRDGWATLTVQDGGVGISEENLAKIFQPFFTTKGYDSVGMGLAGSYGIVTQHGGEISVRSTEGEGTTFTVRLPEAGAAGSEEWPTHEPFERKLKILIIDDMEPVAGMLAEGLSQYGQSVYKALSGPQGLRVFDRNDIDVVICDLGMPGMNGWEVARRVKDLCKERGIPKPPFILLTGWADQVEERDGMGETGVDAVVEKPADIRNMLEVIRTIIDRRESSA